MIAFGFLLLVGLQIIGISEASSNCHKRNSCKCANDDGTGFDLTDMGTSKYALESMGRDEDNVTFYYHPCGDIDIQHTPVSGNQTVCKASSLCMYNHTDNLFTTLGYDKDAEFLESGDQIFIQFKQSNNPNVTSIIQLGCTNVGFDKFVENQVQYSRPVTSQVLDEKTEYNFVLYSPHACKRQVETIQSMSTGSVLVISFCLGVLSYLIVGMAVNYFLIGARGIELIPNLSFWVEFPALVKDGVAFLQNGCNPVLNDELLTPRSPNPDSYVSI